MKDRIKEYVQTQIPAWILLTIFMLIDVLYGITGYSAYNKYENLSVLLVALLYGIRRIEKIYYERKDESKPSDEKTMTYKLKKNATK